VANDLLTAGAQRTERVRREREIAKENLDKPPSIN
jgi:hypothetical protein